MAVKTPNLSTMLLVQNIAKIKKKIDEHYRRLILVTKLTNI